MAIVLQANNNSIYQLKPGTASSFFLTTDGDAPAGGHAYLTVNGWQGGGTNGALINDVQDDQGGTWAQIATIRRTANNHVLSLWRGTGFSGGAPLTAELFYDEDGAAGNHSAAIVTATGMLAAAADDVDTAENSSGSTATSATLVTTVADTLAFAVMFPVDNEGNSISVPSGWTLLEEDEANFATFSFVYRILSATNPSLSAVWTLGGTSSNPLSIIAAFAGSSGGGNSYLNIPDLAGGLSPLTGGLQS